MQVQTMARLQFAQAVANANHEGRAFSFLGRSGGFSPVSRYRVTLAHGATEFFNHSLRFDVALAYTVRRFTGAVYLVNVDTGESHIL